MDETERESPFAMCKEGDIWLLPSYRILGDATAGVSRRCNPGSVMKDKGRNFSREITVLGMPPYSPELSPSPFRGQNGAGIP